MLFAAICLVGVIFSILSGVVWFRNKNIIEGAVMGCEPGCKPIKAALEFYRERHFEYVENKIDDMVLPKILADAFAPFQELDIFPEEAFSPKSYIDGKIRSTDATYCIHHFQSTWRPESIRKGIQRRQICSLCPIRNQFRLLRS